MLEDFCSERLYTKKEFQDYLNTMCANGNHIVSYVLVDGLGNQFTYGKREEREADQTRKLPLNNGYEVKIEVWSDDNVDIVNYVNLFKIYWNDIYTDTTTGIPTTEQSELLDKCNKTLQFYYEKRQKIALIMIDLDNFSNVNNLNNHDVGSRVLGEFAKLIFASFVEKGIVIHQTGDEFNILVPYTDLVDIVDSVKKARDLVNAHDFVDAHDIKLSMAVGIKCIENEQLGYKEARTAAEEIYSNSRRRNTTKQRDSIRISGYNCQVNESIDLKLAWTRMVCNLDYPASNNVFLEYIRKYSKNINDLTSFAEKINEIIEWINPSWNYTNRYLNKKLIMDTSEAFSKVDLCLAIVQGLLKNPNYMSHKFILKYENNMLNIYMNSNIVFEQELSLDYSDAFEGRCCDYYRKNHSDDCKRVLLVQAGYEELQLKEDLFYKIIRVDTRPTTGGGLPDFWAAALCELITIMQESPLVSDILIYGNTENTCHIVEVLNLINKWDNHRKYNLKYLSQKTFKSMEDISKFKGKFQNKIFMIDTEKDLYDKVCRIYDSDIELERIDNNRSALEKRRILQRDLAYEAMRLQICDGCHVKTIADAYPTVLEILRNQEKMSKNKMKDQAGRELFELTDFKIVLSEPKSDELPDYYIGDKELLTSYYSKTFGNDDSLFRKELVKNNQLDSMINHVIQALTGSQKYATRRAVLVVANDVKNADNFSPLGLISIWLAPRFVENYVVIDFSYNWRTVEAVVGLPLSIYASVKFAEELTSLIKERTTYSEYGIHMGTVSYIAHSLHMFLDSESMGIVRGIINDASI